MSEQEKHLALISENDTHGAVWMKLKEWAEKKIAVYQLRLEKPMMENKTVMLRGRIAELRAVLALDKPPVPLVADDHEKFID